MLRQVRALRFINHYIFIRMYQYTTETITPAKAQEYLQHSESKNRPISKVFVRSYADTMKKGKWLLNGVCIIFDDKGNILDGRHRLTAVIEAGIPVSFDVIRGVDPQAFTTYDCGRHRTVGQLLAMQDVKHYNLIASIISANDRLVKSERLCENNSCASASRIKESNADKYNVYREDPEGYSATATVIVRLMSRCRIISGSWAGGIFYYLTHTGGYSENEVLPFFEALFSLDTSDIPVCDLLRKAITKSAMEGKKMKAEMLWALIAKAWNHYIKGESPKILRYQQTQEELPKLKLK